ncbi:unnamed protein product, partial [Prorocentrum cordatum]
EAPAECPKVAAGGRNSPQTRARFGAMADPWQCICEFIRSQSANLQNVIQSLGNQHTISDLDTSDSLTLPTGLSPLHLFMFLLMAVWGFLYVSGRQRQDLDVGKPSSSTSSGSPSSGSGASGSGGQGPPGGPPGTGSGDGELF